MEYLNSIVINYPAQILILAFLAITFIQSAIDKLIDWNGNVSFLKEHFSQSVFKNKVPFLLSVILVLEFITGCLNIIGIVLIFKTNNTYIGLLSSILAGITFLFLLLGQRIAKDYSGAMTIAVYFILAIIGVLILE